MAWNGLRKIFVKASFNSQILRHAVTLQPHNLVSQPSRAYRRYMRPYLATLKKRQKRFPAPAVPVHARIEWNRKAELYAFGRRLNEDFDEKELNTALTHESYVRKERQKRESLGLETDEVFDLKNNATHISIGENAMNEYIKAFLRYSLPYLPEEGICSITEHLISEDHLSYISSNIGISDIVLCDEFPVGKTILAECFKAVIGLVKQSQDDERLEKFVRDFVLAQLIGKDVNDLWEIANPMGMLSEILLRDGSPVPEPRLIREAGRNTMFAVYNVGLYVNKSLIGNGMGETLATAEEMAARDCLKRMFRTVDAKTPFPFRGHPKLDYKAKNLQVNEWTSELANKHASGKLPQAFPNWSELSQVLQN